MLKVSCKGQEIRIIESKGKKYVVAMDVRQLLGVKHNSTIYRHVDPQDRIKLLAEDVLCRKQPLVCLNANGVKDLISKTESKDYESIEMLIQRIIPVLDGYNKLNNSYIDNMENRIAYQDNAIKKYRDEMDCLNKTIKELEFMKEETMEDYINETNELIDEILELEEQLNDNIDKVDQYKQMVIDREIIIDNLHAETYHLYQYIEEMGAITKEKLSKWSFGFILFIMFMSLIAIKLKTI